MTEQDDGYLPPGMYIGTVAVPTTPIVDHVTKQFERLEGMSPSQLRTYKKVCGFLTPKTIEDIWPIMSAMGLISGSLMAALKEKDAGDKRAKQCEAWFVDGHSSGLSTVDLLTGKVPAPQADQVPSEE